MEKLKLPGGLKDSNFCFYVTKTKITFRVIRILYGPWNINRNNYNLFTYGLCKHETKTVHTIFVMKTRTGRGRKNSTHSGG